MNDQAIKERVAEELVGFERKVQRLLRELDIKKLMKEIKIKANEEGVKTELGQHDFKLTTIEKAVL